MNPLIVNSILPLQSTTVSLRQLESIRLYREANIDVQTVNYIITLTRDRCSIPHGSTGTRQDVLLGVGEAEKL